MITTRMINGRKYYRGNVFTNKMTAKREANKMRKSNMYFVRLSKVSLKKVPGLRYGWQLWFALVRY